MRSTRLALALALLIAAAAGPAAATRGVPTRGAPVISGPGAAFHDPSSVSTSSATLRRLDLPGRGDRPPGHGALRRSGCAAEGGALRDLRGRSAVPPGRPQARRVRDQPRGADQIELLFGDLDGAAAVAFRPLALRVAGEFGDDPQARASASFENPVDVEIVGCRRCSLAGEPSLPSSPGWDTWECRLRRGTLCLRRFSTPLKTPPPKLPDKTVPRPCEPTKFLAVF